MSNYPDGQAESARSIPVVPSPGVDLVQWTTFTLMRPDLGQVLVLKFVGREVAK